MVAAALALVAACTSGDTTEEAAELTGPCGLLTESSAEEVLGGDVTRISFIELVERETGDVPESDLPMVEAADAANCVYSLDGTDAVIALQLDLGLFSSVEDFRSAWEDDTEILDAPGLAATFNQDDVDQAVGVNVLLNEAGDSFAVVAYKSSTGRSELLGLAAELTEKYSD